MSDIYEDLEAEEERLEEILGALDRASWLSESDASGWTVADVVLHLAQSEEAVAATAAPAEVKATGSGSGVSSRPTEGATSVDEAMDEWVRAERAEPEVVFERWRKARRDALLALHNADPGEPLRWVAGPMKPKALATTRIAEHWAHGLDITGPLGIPFEDTERLRHVAWLGHRTLPYAFGVTGEEAHEVYCELVGPSGELWTYGPPDAPSRISGPAGAFCRVGARRLTPEGSGLTTSGPYGEAALLALRNYAA